MIMKQIRLTVVSLGVLMLLLAIPTLLLIVIFNLTAAPTISGMDVILFPLAFLIYLGCAIYLVWDMAIIFGQHFYDLSRTEMQGLLTRLLGLVDEPIFSPILRVQEGRANPDGPAVLFKVGGPGYLSIAHDSAVVTSRVGKLHRVLGPGFHKLESFERCWDVIDLRPQRRTVEVEFMTREGIPACCSAEMRFRVAGLPAPKGKPQKPDEMPPQPYTFDPAEVLKLASNKFVKRSEGPHRIADWCVGIAGALDGEIRDLLEKYSLDDFLNPDYGDASNRYRKGDVDELPAKPQALRNIEAEIEARVRETGEQRGIDVEWVRLEPVRPVEGAISRRWLEFWQAKSQRGIDEYAVAGDARRAELLTTAKVEAQIDLLTGILKEVQALTKNGITVPSQLITLGFIDALQTMSERDPGVRMLMLQRMESLVRMLDITPSTPPPTSTSPTT